MLMMEVELDDLVRGPIDILNFARTEDDSARHPLLLSVGMGVQSETEVVNGVRLYKWDLH